MDRLMYVGTPNFAVWKKNVSVVQWITIAKYAQNASAYTWGLVMLYAAYSRTKPLRMVQSPNVRAERPVTSKPFGPS